MTKPLFPLREISGELPFSSPWSPVALRGEIFFSSCLRVFVAHLFLLVCVSAAAAAQDRVTVTRDEKTITLSNGLVEVVVKGERDATEIYGLDNQGRRVKLSVRGWMGGWMNEQDVSISSWKHSVMTNEDGSATLAMRQCSGKDNRTTAYLHLRPGVAVVTWVLRVENASEQSKRPYSLGWSFKFPRSNRISCLHGDNLTGWYQKDADVNVVLVRDHRMTEEAWPELAEADWRTVYVNANRIPLPAYSAFTSQITLGIASGIGPASDASETVAINATKDAGGKWMIAVAPFGRLINAQITVTAGLKTYRQTVNAGPREPIIVDTPLTDEKIAVELKAAGGRVLLRTPPPPPPEVGKSEPTKTDVEAISKRRVAQMNDALKAMEDGRWADALELSRKDEGGSLWMKLIGALAEQQAGHKDEAEKMLRRIVADDPSAAEAWWLLGDAEKAGALGDVKAIRMTMDALRAGRLPGAE